MSELVTSRGTLPLTDEDFVWLARSVYGEGGEPATVIWALASRWVYLTQFAGVRSYPSFASFIRAYSAPVNPRLLAGGALCRPGGRLAGSDHCNARAYRHRARIQAMPLRDLPDRVTLPVLQFFRGQLPNAYPGVTDFRRSRGAASDRAQAQRRGFVYRGGAGGNTLWARPETANWTQGMLRVRGGVPDSPGPAPVQAPSPREHGAGPGLGLLAVVLALLAAGREAEWAK